MGNYTKGMGNMSKKGSKSGSKRVNLGRFWPKNGHFLTKWSSFLTFGGPKNDHFFWGTFHFFGNLFLLG